MNLDSAIFYSNDIEKIIQFYTETLGFKLEYKTARFVSFVFDNNARLASRTKQRNEKSLDINQCSLE